MWTLIAVGILLIAGLGVGAYFFLNRDSRPAIVNNDDSFDEDENDDEMDEKDDAYAIDDEDITDEEPTSEDVPANEPVANNRAAADIEPVAPQPSANNGRGIIMTGDADGYPLTLTLNIGADGNVSGIYKNEQGTEINVSGTESNGVINLRGRSNRGNCSFRIVPDGHIFTGTFTNAAGKRQELHLTSRPVE